MRLKILFIVISLGLFHMVYGISTWGAEVIERGVITGKNVNLRLKPDLSAGRVTLLNIGVEVSILNQLKNWSKVKLSNGIEGWVFNRFLAKNHLMKRSRGNFLQIFEISSFAKHFLGLRYVYGGAAPTGFDCSGFTMYVYKQFGYSLPHNAAAQMQIGVKVAKNELIQGDLLFFTTTSKGKISHVGMYLGAGQFIHASSGYRKIKIAQLDTGYYNARYVGARRIFANQTNNLPITESEDGEDQGKEAQRTPSNYITSIDVYTRKAPFVSANFN